MFNNPRYWQPLDDLLKADYFIDGTITSAKALLPYINSLGKDLVAAEVGTAFGTNMIYIMENCSIAKFIVIDPHEGYQDWGPDCGHGEMTAEVMHGVGDKFLENLSAYSKKDLIQYIKKPADDAKDDIEDESLDYLFIDGNHAEEFVYNDCKNYWSKIKKGGIMSGHDFDASPVQRGVYRFASENNIPTEKIIPAYNINTPPCWLIIKE